MKAQIYSEKMIFMLDDQNHATSVKTSGITKHPYLVISAPTAKNEMAQVMGITSLNKYELSYELPVITVANQVGYLNTTNIYSYGSRAFRLDSYKGILQTDLKDFSADDFIALAMDLYLLQKLPMAVRGREDEIKERYISYLRAFYKHYKIEEKYPDFCNQKGWASKDLSKRADKEEETLKANNSSIIGEAISKALVEAKPEKKKEPQKKVASVLGESSKEEKSMEISKKNLSILLTSSCHMSKWSDVEVILFVKGYEKLGRSQFLKLCPIAKSEGALYQRYKRAKDEYNKRGL